MDEYIVDLPSSFGDDFKMGVVISYDLKHDQTHCGVAFNLGTNQQAIHLATHNNLTHDDTLNGFNCIIKPNIHPILQDSMVSLCEALRDDILDGNNKVPYGFLYDDYAIIESDGKLRLTEREIGFTCATYVLTLFHSCGFDLVDIDNWPPREEDRTWFENIINIFRRFASFLGIDPDHLKKMESQTNVPRFRPEEVAVSSALFNEHHAETPLIWAKGNELKIHLASII